MKFEDILEDVGSYGSYQRNLILFFAGPVTFLAPFLSMAIIFVVSVPDHWCRVPEVMASNLSIHQQRSFVEAQEDHHCLMSDINYAGFIAKEYVNVTSYTNTTNCRYEWEYDKNDFDSTAATKWNMVCDDSYFPSLILMLRNVGNILGTLVYGHMADKFGRKVTFFIAVAITSMTELFSILTSNFVIFVILKAISGAIHPTIFSLPYIIVSEILHPEKRGFCTGVMNISWVFGMCVLPLVAYLSRSWINLGIVNTLAGITILLYWKFIPESPLWLISIQQYEKALNIMIRIGKKNKKVPDKALLLQKLKLLGERIKKEKENEKQNFCISIFKYPRFLKIFFILTFSWIAVSATYNGLLYNVTGMKGNEFFNFFLLAIVEAPGYGIGLISMERIGRRWTTVIGFIAAGITCLASITGLPYCETIGSVIAKMFSSCADMVSMQQCCELFPTVYRSFATGLTKTIANIITLVMPYVIYLGRYGKFIPFVVISLLCITAGILSAFLPETLNENLPQNLSDAEQIGRNQKFFSFNRKKRLVNNLVILPKEQCVNKDQGQIKISVID